MTLRQAIGIALDIINSNPEQLEGMRHVTKVKDEHFSWLELTYGCIRENLIEGIENRHKYGYEHYPIGFWYGRLIDPRWQTHIEESRINYE